MAEVAGRTQMAFRRNGRGIQGSDREPVRRFPRTGNRGADCADQHEQSQAHRPGEGDQNQGCRRPERDQRHELNLPAAASSAVIAPAPDSDLAAIFGAGGTLARTLRGFRFRPQQLAMAVAVARAIAERTALVAEAGTGTGKTFAYLVPALLYGGKVIISTGTKNLQDQLYNRDLPTVRDALQVPVSTALLKGRANYVCHHYLEGALADGRFASREDVAHLHKIARFAKVSRTGDRAEP